MPLTKKKLFHFARVGESPEDYLRLFHYWEYVMIPVLFLVLLLLLKLRHAFGKRDEEIESIRKISPEMMPMLEKAETSEGTDRENEDTSD